MIFEEFGNLKWVNQVDVSIRVGCRVFDDFWRLRNVAKEEKSFRQSEFYTKWYQK